MFFSIPEPHKTLFKSGEKEIKIESIAISLIALENIEDLKRNIETSFEKRKSIRAKGKLKIILKESAEKMYFELSSRLPFNSDTNFAIEAFNPKSDKS